MNGGRRKWRSGTAVALAAAAVWGLSPAGLSAEEASRLEPIVVTATRIEQKVSEQASAVSVVTREEIELGSPVVAGDALKALPGLDVQRSGSAGNRENIKIRGGLSPHTLVMIDGFKVNSPTLGQFDIGSLTLEDFERIEVIRGPQSALYGSNAMAGVVNFLPRKGVEGPRFGSGLSGGSFSTVKWSLFGEGGAKAGSVHLGASGLESDGDLSNDGASIVNVLGTGEASLGARSRLHAIVLYSKQDKEVPIDFGTPRDDNHDVFREGLLGGARFEVQVTKALAVAIQGNVFDEEFLEKDPADPGEAFPFVFEDDTDTRKTDLELQARIELGGVSTTFVGAESLKDHASDSLQSNFGDTDIDDSTTNRSLYVQEELKLGKHAGMSIGARLDRNSEAGTEFNPKAAAYYDFERIGTRVRAAAGRGFRVPTISEVSDPFVGNPGLSSETVVAWEAGIEVTLPWRGATIAATWFHQDFEDLIQFDPAAPGPAGFGELRNVGSAFSRGVEAEVKAYPLPQVGVLLAYTFTETRDEENDRRILGIPTHRGTASVLLSPSPRWEARVDWRVEGNQLDAPPNGTDIRRDGYSRLDLFARYRRELSAGPVREISLKGRVENLLDRDYEERKGFPAPGINVLVGAEMRL